jgi:hypothetical protein
MSQQMYSLTKFFAPIFLLFLSQSLFGAEPHGAVPASAQSSLPPCASTRGVWNRCFGTRTSATGKYVCEFRDGGFNGHGTVTLPDGTKFVGEWKDGMPNGEGTVTLPDGTTYVGEFPISTRRENQPGRPGSAFNGWK